MRSVKGMLTSPLVGLAMVLVTVPLAPGFAAPSTPGSARGHHAKIELTTQQGQWDLAGPVAFSYQEPELKHAGRKVRTRFSAAFATLLSEAQTGLGGLRTQLGCTTPGSLTATADAGIYKRRYVSVVLKIAMVACEEESAGAAAFPQYPAGFMLDLARKGKPVSATKLVSDQYGLRDAAVNQTLYATYAGECSTDYQLGNPLPETVVWGASKAGLSAYFPKYAVGPAVCGVMSTTVPWRLLATPKQARGKERAGYYALSGSTYCGKLYCDGLGVHSRGDVVSVVAVGTGITGWVGVRRGRGGTFFTTENGVGSVEELRFSGRSPVAKPSQFGPEWVKLTEAEMLQYFPGLP